MQFTRLNFPGFLLLLLVFFLPKTPSLYAQHYSYTKGMPTNAFEKLKEHQNKKRDIRAFTFTRDDQWVIVADNVRSYSSLSYFDNIGLRPKITEYINAGKKVDAIAFSEKNEWVLIADDFQWFSNVNFFNSCGLRPKLRDLRSKNKRIASVTMGPKNCWVVITKDKEIHFSNNIKNELPELWKSLYECKNTAKRPVSFVSIIPPSKSTGSYPAGKRWVMVTDNYFWSERWTSTARKKMVEYQDKKRRVNYVTLRPRGGWSIISNEKLIPSPGNNKAFEFETNLKTTKDGVSYSLAERMSYHNVPGVSIVVINNGKVVLSRGYGTQKAGTDKAVYASSTLFPAASTSKAVGALAWGIYATTKPNLKITDPLQTIVSRFKPSSSSTFMKWYNAMLKEDVRVKQITVQQLLSHTSGLNVHGIGAYPLSGIPSLSGILFNPDNSLRVKFEDPPAKYSNYSGGAYTVAEALLAVLTQQSAKSYADQKILNRLKMYKSSFDIDAQKENAFGHNKNGSPIPLGDCPGEFAGGLVTTSVEYANFVLALMHDGKFENRQVFPKYHIDLMQTNQVKSVFSGSCSSNSRCNGICFAKAGTTNAPTCASPYRSDEINEDTNEREIVYYGLGLSLSANLDSNNYPTRFSHGGTHDGYYCRFRVHKDQNEAIIIMTNGKKSWEDSNGKTRGANQLVDEIQRSFIDNF